jgi:phospholipid-binding lipoprotein MlaA
VYSSPVLSEMCVKGAFGPRGALRRGLAPLLLGSALLAPAAWGQEVLAPDTAVVAAPPVVAPPASAPTEEAEQAQTGTGDIVVSSQGRRSRTDPLASVNAVSFEAVQAVDRVVVEPAAKAYESAVPGPVRDGVHNVLYNLHQPVIAVNFLLQHKIGKASETVARLVINSTLGVAGIFDIARRKPFKLPHRPNGFGNTLGFYGLPPGPYMYLPMLGSIDARDLAGTVIDRLTLPTLIGANLTNPAFTVPLIVLNTLDRRLVNDERLTRLREGPLDHYVATREDYLRRRRMEIAALREGREQPEEMRDRKPEPVEPPAEK